MVISSSPSYPISGLGLGLETNQLADAVRQIHEQTASAREALSGLGLGLETNQLADAVRQIHEQTASAREALSGLGLGLETNQLADAVRQIHEQTASIRDALSGVALGLDIYPMSDTAPDNCEQVAYRNASSESGLDSQSNQPADILPATDDRASETSEASTEPICPQEIRAAQHAALADAVAHLLVLLDVSPYFLQFWIEAVTSNNASAEEVDEARSALIRVLNAVIPRDDGTYD